jgi:inner membrane protease ATP23
MAYEAVFAPQTFAAPRIHALVKRIDSAGCTLAPTPVVCEDIFEGVSALAAFDSKRRLVVMNPAVPEKFLEQREWTRSIAHELVHAYDYCRADLDVSSCRHMACTEIRAANLSGECDFGAEFSRVGFPLHLAGHQQRCVRRRAEKSISMSQACIGQDAKLNVDDVFEHCYSDTAPFPTN